MPLDQGLSIMSKHAKALGYDAVILFLDELILWLASHAADMNFISHEGTKLVKLVEATHADRPIPLISFVARQRDLRELVGETLAAGSVQTQFNDSLRHWEARFEVIKLEDRNLPAIAEQRVLRPVSAEAKRTLDEAFRKLLDARRDVLETLQTDDADREMFRKLYPFSPALVATLVAVSSVLQRERTALKLMMQLLVDRRDELEVGEIKISDDPQNPVVSIQVTGVDLEPVLENARIHDNLGNRRRMLRALLFAELELESSSDLFTTFQVQWRGTRREVDISYENVRLMSAERLHATQARSCGRRGAGGDPGTAHTEAQSGVAAEAVRRHRPDRRGVLRHRAARRRRSGARNRRP